MKVTARKRFFLTGQGLVGPGEIEVPGEKVGRLVEKELIDPPGDAAWQSQAQASDGGRVEAALARISAALSVERASGESAAEFLERVAEQVEGQSGSSSDELPEDFPHRELLAGTPYNTKEALRAASDDDILAVKGIGEAKLGEIREALK